MTDQANYYKKLGREFAELSRNLIRYNNRIANGVDDVQRAEKALKGVKGKRLTYRRPNEENVTSGL